MTVIGEAWILIKGVDETSTGVKKAESDVAGVGATAEKSSGRARAAFKAMGGALGAAFGPAFGPIGEIADKFQGLGQITSEMHGKIAKSLLGVGAGATAAGTLITTWSDKDKVATKQLQIAVQNAGGEWDKYKDKTEEVIHHQETYGHTAVETQDALSTLVTKTHQVSASYDNMQLVADLAAQKHTSLASAAQLVSRVMLGNTRSLKLYGISQDDINKKLDTGAIHEKNMALAQAENQNATIKSTLRMMTLRDAHLRELEAATKDKGEQAKLRAELQADSMKRTELSAKMSENSDKATKLKADLKTLTTGTLAGSAGVQLLADKLKGQAAAASDTFSGRMAMIKAKVEDFIGTVGQKVGPALQAVGPALMGFGAIMESGIIGKTGKAVKMLVTWNSESKIVMAATKVWTGIQWALDAAMDAFGGPVLLIIAAIAALGVAIYLAYTKFKPFHDLVNRIAHDLKAWFLDAFHAVTNAFKDFAKAFETVWNFIVGIVKRYGLFILAALAPFIGIPLLIITHWKQIVGVFQQVFNDIVNGFQWLVGKISGIIGNIIEFFTKMPGRIGKAIGNLGRAIWSGITAGFDWLKAKFTDAISLWVDIYIRFPIRVLRAIGNLGSKIWQSINDGLATMKSKIMDFIGGVVSFFATFPTKVMRAIGNLGSQIWSGITTGLSNMKDKVANWIGNVVSWFGALPAKVVRAIGNLGNAIWNGISSGISALGTKLYSAISKLGTSVKNGAVGAATWLYNAGKQLVQGFINGIGSMFSSVANAAKNLIGSLGHSVLHVLHIGSPSKVYHEIGRNVALGLIQGLDHSQGDVARAGQRLANAAIRNPDGTIGLPMHMNAAGVHGSGNVINLFPGAKIDFGKQSPAQVVKTLEMALRSSRF